MALWRLGASSGEMRGSRATKSVLGGEVTPIGGVGGRLFKPLILRLFGVIPLFILLWAVIPVRKRRFSRLSLYLGRIFFAASDCDLAVSG